MASKKTPKKTVARAGKALVKSVESAADSTVHKARANAAKHMASARKKFVAAEKRAESYVQKNPKTAALIAASVGAAIAAAVALSVKKK